MQRPGGEIYVEPCEGQELPPGSLIRLRVSVYGLHDAPLSLRKTVIETLERLGFQTMALEPCWWVLRQKERVVQHLLLEVDDFLIGSASAQQAEWLENS